MVNYEKIYFMQNYRPKPGAEKEGNYDPGIELGKKLFSTRRTLVRLVTIEKSDNEGFVADSHPKVKRARQHQYTSLVTGGDFLLELVQIPFIPVRELTFQGVLFNEDMQIKGIPRTYLDEQEGDHYNKMNMPLLRPKKNSPVELIEAIQALYLTDYEQFNAAIERERRERRQYNQVHEA